MMRNRTRGFFIAILMPAILLAQMSGLAHRLDHAQWSNGKLLYAKADSRFAVENPDGQHRPVHSCSLFDAGTVTECLHASPSLSPDDNGNYSPPRHSGHSAWITPPPIYFSSRAPPRAAAIPGPFRPQDFLSFGQYQLA